MTYKPNCCGRCVYVENECGADYIPCADCPCHKAHHKDNWEESRKKIAWRGALREILEESMGREDFEKQFETMWKAAHDEGVREAREIVEQQLNKVPPAYMVAHSELKTAIDALTALLQVKDGI